MFFLEEVPWVQVADPRGGKRWLENSATTFGGTCLGKGTQDMPTTYLYRMRSVMFYHFIFLIFLIRIYYIYAIFKIKVKVMAYILHIYMCRNSNGVNVCLCVFWNVFVLSLSMFATAPIFLETHVVESPRPSRSGAEHQWWQDWGGEQPAAFPPWPHPCQ